MGDTFIPASRRGVSGWLHVESSRFIPKMAGADPVADAKDKLKRIEAELASERDRKAGLAKERDEARDAFAGSESLSQDSPEFKAAQEKVAALGSCEDRIAELQGLQVATLKMLGEKPPEPQNGGGPSAPSALDRWNSADRLASSELQAVLTHAATSKGRAGGIEIGEVATRDALAADITGTSNMRRGDYLGVIPELRRALSVLDLIPTGTMNSNTLPYTQETGAFTGAAETAEGSLKPEAAFTPVDATATAVTIAAWNKLQKQSVSDFPALQSIIDNRLRYEVELRLENEVLAGSGSGANMTGILNTSGLGAVTFTAGALVTEQVLKGITTAMLAFTRPNGIVLHPTDWQTALLAKTSGSGEYFGGGPFNVTPQQMWGVPIVPSVAITQGTALVGDFTIGAQLFIREGVNVLLSDSDQDDFIRNRFTLLAEMRAALAVFRPAAFATVALQ